VVEVFFLSQALTKQAHLVEKNIQKKHIQYMHKIKIAAEIKKHLYIQLTMLFLNN